MPDAKWLGHLMRDDQRTERRLVKKPAGPCLVPASPAVPAATENNNHDDQNDEKRGVVHLVLPNKDGQLTGRGESLLIQVGCLYKIAHTRLTTRPARFSRLGAIEPIGFARGPGGRILNTDRWPQ